MTVTTDPEATAPSMVRAGAAVGLAMGLANVLQYALQLVAGRQLTTGGFGGFGALLGLGIVGAVPMLALQTVAARHIAQQRATAASLFRTARRVGLTVTVLGLAVSPVVATFLHVPVAGAAWLALSLGPLALAGTAQGVLQGQQRFHALAGLFLAVSTLRVGGGILGLALSAQVTWGLAGTALGAMAAGALAHAAIRTDSSSADAGSVWRELVAASNGVLALLVLAGLDLLLARHVLTADSSGRYAAGALVARACFWLPQFVAVLVVPRLASGETGLVRRAAGLVGALGVLEVLGGLLLPGSVVRLLLGEHYGPLTHRLALFAAEGACLAVLQLLLYAEIAQGGHAIGRLLWGCVAVESGLVLVTRPGLTGTVLLALGCTAATLLVALRTTATSRAIA